jgi:hypothetical protein
MLVAVSEGSCWWRFWRGQLLRAGKAVWDRDGAGGQMGDGRSQRVRAGRYGRRMRTEETAETAGTPHAWGGGGVRGEGRPARGAG